jgi:hypothetical protein
MTSFESYVNDVHKAAYILDGFFKAPETGRYRFYLTSDDYSNLFLDYENPFDPDAPATDAPEFNDNDFIAKRNHWCEWRHYWAEMPLRNHNTTSQWIQLTKDEFYPIQGFVVEGGGLDHITVAVEFEQANTENHHHAAREVQMLTIEHDGILEEWELIIE